jgi:uncharacterized membrane protein YdjX (TVP38/TMEM64 family)
MHDTSTEQNQNPILTWGLTILVLVFSAGVVFYISQNEETVDSFVEAAGVLGPLVCVGLFALLGISPVPSEVLSLIVGRIYGGLEGTLISFAGNMIAGWIEYYIGMHIGKIADFEERRQHLPFGLGKFPADSAYFLLFARFVPGYGPKLVGIIGGIYKVPLWRYTWTCAIPVLAGAAMWSYGGFGLSLLNLQPK